MPAARTRALAELAGAVACGRVVLDGARSLEDTVAALEALPGIGPWTAGYIAMRALAEPDAFPAADLGLRRALVKRDGTPPSAAEMLARAEHWRPWRSYATLYLWTVGDEAPARGRARRGRSTTTPARGRARKPKARKEDSRATAA
jgi:AraC family transcriptional regulator of adaptative response / DNA-3-methyladenine glycosylase II